MRTNGMFKSLIGEVALVYKKKSINKVSVKESRDAVDFSRNIWPDDINIRESVVVLHLNRCNNIISWFNLSNGGISGTVCDVRLAVKTAIDSLASGVIMIHNHPSGNSKPSDSDSKIALKMKEGMKFLGIEMLDNIIITDDGHYSFADNGLL